MRINILGVGFDNVTMDEALARGEELLCSEGAHYVVTPNPEIVETCRADAAANAAVNGADLVLPDGIGIVYGAKILHQPLRGRVPGIEFGTGMIERCAKLGKSVYLLGAKQEVVSATVEVLQGKYPKMIIAGYRDGYFSEEEFDAVVNQVSQEKPDIVFVGITSPKKERLIERFRDLGVTGIYVGVGGSFDVVSGNIPRAPMWMQKANLEWLFRMMQEPGRLAKRYVIGNVKFLSLLQKEKAKAKKCVKR